MPGEGGAMKLENAYFITQIFAGFAVVFSLIFVGLSVNQNTAAIERQGRLDYVTSITQPYLDDVPMGEILAKVKAVDGRESLVAAFMNKYNLTEVEAAAWNRHLYLIWYSIEADFYYSGPEFVEDLVHALIPYPDARTYWDNNKVFHSEEFVNYVNKISNE